MPASFARTLRALHMERSAAPAVAAGLALALLVAWTLWMALASVPEYRTSRSARLEVRAAPHRIAAPVAGTVVAARLEVGARVAAGDVLVELDSSNQRIQRDGAAARLAALAPEAASVDREIAVEDAALARGGAETRAAQRELLARQRAADVALELAEEELVRAEGLVAAGTAAVADRSRARSEVDTRRAARDALGHQGEALALSERERDSGRRTRREQLERQRSELQAALATARGELARLDHDVERRTIRAVVAGVLGEVAALRPGVGVADGERVATIVPDGDLQVVADYGPEAIGRLAAGQPARLRLDGFPWTRWGTVPATVARVASEARDGGIRVELDLGPAPASELPLAHGMTGVVDVEVDRASPASRVLRALGDRRAGDPR